MRTALPALLVLLGLAACAPEPAPVVAVVPVAPGYGAPGAWGQPAPGAWGQGAPGGWGHGGQGAWGQAAPGAWGPGTPGAGLGPAADSYCREALASAGAAQQRAMASGRRGDLDRAQRAAAQARRDC